MKPILSGEDALRRLFAALTEQTFQAELGVADPRLTDYLVDLLVRFVRIDTIYRFRDLTGRRLEEVAEMLMEAEQLQDNGEREMHRHIGDFTLFWSGVYPEALSRMQSESRQDHLIDYLRQGKQSYYIASTFSDAAYEEESSVLRRLSQEFELCSFGLSRVRREWEKLPGRADKALWNPEQN